jgi:hypothetical protein
LLYPNRIILAVDNRLTYTDNLTGEKKYNTGCKLAAVNNFAFAFIGYRGFNGSVGRQYGNFNTELFIKALLNKRNIGVSQTIRELADGLDKVLTEQYRIMRKQNYKYYNDYLKKNNGNIMNLIVIGNDNGHPFACGMNVTLIEVDGTTEVQVQGSEFQNKTDILHAGVTDAVARYIKANPPKLQKEEPIALMDRLMNLVIKDKPLEAGLPIQIAEATKNGVKWVRDRNVCAN